jgi:hypothetical protein
LSKRAERAEALKNYIVRIYRHEENKPRRLVGIVEEPGVKDKKAFTTYSELWEILKSGKGSSWKRKRKKTLKIS